jgi:hypothetical protein
METSEKKAMQEGGKCGGGGFQSGHAIRIRTDKRCQVALGIVQRLK